LGKCLNNINYNKNCFLQYYAHREKMRDVGREDELETINRKALQIAKEVARENNKLFAGGLCNSNLYDPNKPETIQECENMFTVSI